MELKVGDRLKWILSGYGLDVSFGDIIIVQRKTEKVVAGKHVYEAVKASDNRIFHWVMDESCWQRVEPEQQKVEETGMKRAKEMDVARQLTEQFCGFVNNSYPGQPCTYLAGHLGRHSFVSKDLWPIVPAILRCAPDCTPRNPCMTKNVCPAYAEVRYANEQKEWFNSQKGISAEPATKRYAAPSLRCEQMWACGLVRTGRAVLEAGQRR